MKGTEIVRVVFVCLGNICRSPMAEAVLRKLASDRGLAGVVSVDSAGTGDWHLGHPPHEGTRRLLDGAGISWEGMTARQVSRQDLEEADYLVCMDANNERDVRQLFLNDGIHPSGVVMRFMELLPERGMDGVPDPYYTGNFEETYELVTAGCERLLDRIFS